MKTNESYSRDIMRLVVWYPLRWLILLLPVSLALVVLRGIGDLHWLIARRGKVALRRELEHLGGVGNVNLAIRDYYRNHYIDHLLIFIIPRLNRKRIGNLAVIEGLEHVESARGAGCGVVLVHGHFGPVHLPLVALSRLGLPMKQIGNLSDHGLSWIGRHVAFRLRAYYESKIPAEIISAKGFLKDAFKWLAANGIIMTTGDGSGTDEKLGRHEIFTFLGRDFEIPVGPALLAQKTGAALIPMFILPGKGCGYRIVIEEPIKAPGVDQRTAVELTSEFLSRYERRIREMPGWMHFLDRLEHSASSPSTC